MSVEYDLSHIQACKGMIGACDPYLEKQIEFRHGHSLSVMPGIFADLGSVHFFCLDGGAHPEVCLAEFEHALA